MVLRFSTVDNEDAGKVIIHFTKPPKFEIWHCTTSRIDFFVTYSYIPTDNYVWAITQIRETNEFRLLIHLKSTKIADFVLSDETCKAEPGDWRTYWSKSVARMNFEVDDNASDLYRLGKQIILFFGRKYIIRSC